MKTNFVQWMPDCNICGLPLYEKSITTGGVCRGHPNINDELDDILKQFDIDAVADYWKALADKRLELLKRLIMDLSWCPICGTTLIHEVTYERFSHTDDCELAEAIAEE